MQRSYVTRFAVALAGIAVFAGTASAAGEPKNQPPFTRHVTAKRAVEAATATAQPAIRGESKADRPFTRRVAP